MKVRPLFYVSAAPALNPRAAVLFARPRPAPWSRSRPYTLPASAHAAAPHFCFPLTPHPPSSRAQIYVDFITGEEYFSDAKKVEVVEWKDPETGEAVDTGLVRVVAQKQTQGGVKIAGVGGAANADFAGGEKEGGDDDDAGGDEAEETKLDQFWNFPSIENEHSFATFGEFKKNYFTPFLVAWQKLSVEKGLAKDAAEMKAKGRKMNDNTGACSGGAGGLPAPPCGARCCSPPPSFFPLFTLSPARRQVDQGALWRAAVLRPRGLLYGRHGDRRQVRGRVLCAQPGLCALRGGDALLLLHPGRLQGGAPIKQWGPQRA